MYLSNFTRPDISYAVGKLSRYTSNPNLEHWNALEGVFKCLKGTINYEIHYDGFPSVLEGFNEANWISDSNKTNKYIICSFYLQVLVNIL